MANYPPPAEPAMTWLRRLGGALLAAAAVVVWFTMAPESSEPTEHDEELTEILNNAEANNARAEGAPQQEVVNGWATRDLLALTVVQNDQLSDQAQRDERPAAFLGLTILGVALIALTTPSRRPVPMLATEVDTSSAESIPDQRVD